MAASDPDGTIEVPLEVRLHLGRAAVQTLAQTSGIELLHIKGDAVDPTVRAAGQSRLRHRRHRAARSDPRDGPGAARPQLAAVHDIRERLSIRARPDIPSSDVGLHRSAPPLPRHPSRSDTGVRPALAGARVDRLRGYPVSGSQRAPRSPQSSILNAAQGSRRGMRSTSAGCGRMPRPRARVGDRLRDRRARCTAGAGCRRRRHRATPRRSRVPTLARRIARGNPGREMVGKGPRAADGGHTASR